MLYYFSYKDINKSIYIPIIKENTNKRKLFGVILTKMN